MSDQTTRNEQGRPHHEHGVSQSNTEQRKEAEKTPERIQPSEAVHVQPADDSTPQPVALPSTASVVFAGKSELQKDVEHILEEGLSDIYLSLSTKQRQQFRIEGERVAAKIAVLLKQAVVKLFEIVKLIRVWLALLPGVNRFFLEQEAKIRAEKIALLRDDEHSK